jgi:hypothetical protein
MEEVGKLFLKKMSETDHLSLKVAVHLQGGTNLYLQSVVLNSVVLNYLFFSCTVMFFLIS